MWIFPFFVPIFGTVLAHALNVAFGPAFANALFCDKEIIFPHVII